MDTKAIPADYQHMSPAGAEIRLLMNNPHGCVVHCTLPTNKITKAVTHKTVSEFWHVLSGTGQIWRRHNGEESVTDLYPGITIDIPLGTDFQYRSDVNEDLVFICVTMPPWPGADEATYVDDGKWHLSN